MIKERLAKELSIDVSVKGWEKTFDSLDKQGRLDNKTITSLVRILCEEVEKIQEKDSVKDVVIGPYPDTTSTKTDIIIDETPTETK